MSDQLHIQGPSVQYDSLSPAGPRFTRHRLEPGSVCIVRAASASYAVPEARRIRNHSAALEINYSTLISDHVMTPNIHASHTSRDACGHHSEQKVKVSAQVNF